MDKLTFHNPEVEPILTSRFELIKIDVTQETRREKSIASIEEGLRSGAAVPAPELQDPARRVPKSVDSTAARTCRR
jgi:hypothetical protein